MKTKTITAVVLGAIGLFLPLWLPMEALSFAGQLTMGIFLMAAVFWVMEPIPIYATSMVVILLQVMLLSSQGPVYRFGRPECIHPQCVDVSYWAVPESSIRKKGDRSMVYLKDGGLYPELEVEVRGVQAEKAIVESPLIDLNAAIVADANHWCLGYKPTSFTHYIHTLANPIIMLFLGGFVLASGAVKHQLDRNLIRIMLKPFGSRPGGVLFGLMLVTAILSAFMSNTATTAMMMAVILPILSCVPEDDRFRTGLALCIPFSANIGGIATPIGTPPNAIALNALTEKGASIPFSSWVMLTAPLVLILLASIWLMLVYFFPCKSRSLNLDMKGAFDRSPKAIALYGVFGLTVVLWATEAWHGISSSMVALLPVALLPAFGVVGKEEIRNLPWEVLWLMAGGISLGVSMQETGLASWMVNLVPWQVLGPVWIMVTFGLVSILLATFISHTVAASLLLPLLMGLVGTGEVSGFSVESSALVVAIGTSLAMALPISTPPNAIAMSTGMVKVSSMARLGSVVGVLGYGLMLLLAVLVWSHIV